MLIWHIEEMYQAHFLCLNILKYMNTTKHEFGCIHIPTNTFMHTHMFPVWESNPKPSVQKAGSIPTEPPGILTFHLTAVTFCLKPSVKKKISRNNNPISNDPVVQVTRFYIESLTTNL